MRLIPAALIPASLLLISLYPSCSPERRAGQARPPAEGEGEGGEGEGEGEGPSAEGEGEGGGEGEGEGPTEGEGEGAGEGEGEGGQEGEGEGGEEGEGEGGEEGEGEGEGGEEGEGEGGDDCPDPDDPDVHYESRDPDFCERARIFCEEGQELFSNECGCGCIGPEAPDGECNGPCTCPQGALCADGQCENGFVAEWCCTIDGCPEGERCINPDRSNGVCGGGADG